MCDVIGAWLVCLAVAAACTLFSGAADTGPVERAAALTNPDPTVAAVTDDRGGKRRC
jgi:hypothetical protein